MPRAFRFSYHADLRDREPPQPHKARDGDAFIEIWPVLSTRYEFGGLLFNPPAPPMADRDSPPDMDFRTDDVLVLTTRPPLDDDGYADKRWIRRSYTPLEEAVLSTLRTYFDVCTGSQIKLESAIRDRLGDLSRCGILNFYVNNAGGHLRNSIHRYLDEHHWVDWNDGVSCTAAYLLYLRSEAWPKGPGLLCSFSQGGTQTLLWNHYLRTRHILSSTLDGGSSITVALMDMDRVPGNFTTLDLPGHWGVRQRVSIRLERDRGAWRPVGDAD